MVSWFSGRRIQTPADLHTNRWWTSGRPDTLDCEWSAGRYGHTQPIRTQIHLLLLETEGFIKRPQKYDKWFKYIIVVEILPPLSAADDGSCSSLAWNSYCCLLGETCLSICPLSPSWPWGTCSSLLCWRLSPLTRTQSYSSEEGSLQAGTPQSERRNHLCVWMCACSRLEQQASQPS